MHRARRVGTAAPIVVVVAAALMIGGCTGDDASVPTTSPIPGVPARPVTTMASVTDRFCDAIVSLDGRAGDEPARTADVLAVYDSVADDAPEEIAADFDIVRGGLRALLSGEAVADGAAVDEAAEQLSIWVDNVCRSTDRSPLPPPTQPGGLSE